MVLTVHLSLKQINGTSNANRMHRRWFSYLQRFVFSIKHRLGSSNKVADTLSRRNSVITIMRLKVTSFDEIKDLYESDVLIFPIFGHNARVTSRIKIIKFRRGFYSSIPDYVFHSLH